MIISRTPFRVSFAGGGSDLPAYYEHSDGAVVSMAIGSYMYVTLNKRFDDTVRLSYTRTEIVDHASELEHEIVREALAMFGVDHGVEITTIADVPAGTGLGSSSSLSVGLIAALSKWSDSEASSAEDLAARACELEIDRLGHPIGKQDQYAAAYGGLNFIQFKVDGAVEVNPIECSDKTQSALFHNLLLFYTGQIRDADSILADQSEQTRTNNDSRVLISKMVGIASEIKCALERSDLDEFGRLLNEGWLLKRTVSAGISNDAVDRAYDAGLDAGALGGKLLGAGGGGFLLFYCPHRNQESLRNAMNRLGLREFEIRPDTAGAQVIFQDTAS